MGCGVQQPSIGVKYPIWHNKLGALQVGAVASQQNTAVSFISGAWKTIRLMGGNEKMGQSRSWGGCLCQVAILQLFRYLSLLVLSYCVPGFSDMILYDCSLLSSPVVKDMAQKFNPIHLATRITSS